MQVNGVTVWALSARIRDRGMCRYPVKRTLGPNRSLCVSLSMFSIQIVFKWVGHVARTGTQKFVARKTTE